MAKQWRFTQGAWCWTPNYLKSTTMSNTPNPALTFPLTALADAESSLETCLENINELRKSDLPAALEPAAVESLDSVWAQLESLPRVSNALKRKLEAHGYVRPRIPG